MDENHFFPLTSWLLSGRASSSRPSDVGLVCVTVNSSGWEQIAKSYGIQVSLPARHAPLPLRVGKAVLLSEGAFSLLLLRSNPSEACLPPMSPPTPRSPLMTEGDFGDSDLLVNPLMCGVLHLRP